MAEYSFLLILGAVIGSFLNVLILRLPQNQSVVTPRSTTPCCNTQIKWYHNIPLFSYVFLKGRCAYCDSQISVQYFFVELISAFITVVLFMKLGMSLEFVLVLLLFYTLIVLAFIDLKYHAVPDYLLLISLVLVFMATFSYVKEAFLAALIFAGFFSLLEFVMTFYVQNIKSKIVKDESLKQMKALGEGDIPIVAIIGAILGIKAGIVAIFLAALFAIIPAIYFSMTQKQKETPFIPYLLMGLTTEYFLEISKVI